MTHTADLIVHADRAVVDGIEQPATVVVNAGRVAAVLTGPDTSGEIGWQATATVTLDADHVLLPGMVDTHVHVNEPGRTDWEGFATATRAALAGGTTTIVDMPLNSLPPTTTAAALETKRDAARPQVWVDVGFWGGAIPGNLDDLEKLDAAGVFGFKCFLADSGVPEFPPLAADELVTYLRRCAELDALLIVHAEDAATLAATPPTQSNRYTDFTASRPDAGEVTAIEAVIAAAEETGGRAHILHLSSAAALPAIRAARERGVRLTVETCPHYLTFTAETIRDGSTAHKCCPPIRSDANRSQLWEALADGTIDCVVSDHSPSTIDLKQGDLASAWGGVASVQLALSAVWTEARRRGHTLADVTGWMASAPADLVGLRQKGRIAVGADADLVAYSPDVETAVDAATLQHKSKLTAYQDLTLAGRADRIWLRGNEIGLDRSPTGTLLRHERTP
ncbi:allantoinase AllB [Flexivirga sp. ID2601S]|uniref:allantoinase n=1 Tax=Flexivirga aerilata TaxID=1656889 RepID=A0A849AMH7_9MICO|nr:allantoinase AllB [Flexivirga aerilata]NNG40571.1 allantoinase AllB [Flexivirga aerilata]